MKVLAIDDQPEVLKQIERAIAAAEGPDGKRYEVAGLADHREAVRRLDTEHFDVVIVDMVMGHDETEGLTVLRTLTNKSPITIVLTAYPSIPNCAESMRAGAWDYLEKVPANGSDPYENLLTSLRRACEFRIAHPEAGRTLPDLDWAQQHLGELLRQHAGEVVAVLDEKVVGYGTSYAELAARMKDQYPAAAPTLISLPEIDVEAVE
jgi:DNA-binding NtrC family response regulator